MEDYGYLVGRLVLPQCLKNVGPINVGHDQIHQDSVRLVLSRAFNRLEASLREQNLEPANLFEGNRRDETHRRIIINDEDFHVEPVATPLTD